MPSFQVVRLRSSQKISKCKKTLIVVELPCLIKLWFAGVRLVGVLY